MPRKSASKRKQESEPLLPPLSPQAKKELWAILLVALAGVSILSLFGAAGTAGSLLDSGLAALFGLMRYVIPFILLGTALSFFFPDTIPFKPGRAVGISLLLLTVGGLLNIIRFSTPSELLFVDNLSQAGGYAGLALGYPLLTYVGFWAALILLIALSCVGLVLAFNFSLQQTMLFVKNLFLSSKIPETHEDDEALAASMDADAAAFKTSTVDADEIDFAEGDTDGPNPVLIEVKRQKFKPISIPFDLLENKNSKPTSGDVNGRMMVIKKTLDNFNIPVEMGEISIGPTVTQFTLKPSEGIKLSRITGLSDNLAMALAAHPIRVEAPIPGKALVGIEVPNHTIATVGLREVLESKEFKERKSNLSICLGKDVAGKPWIADLTKMPHLLVAGATGSGKTVCLNTIILSLIYQNSPNDLKLILIDPKRVELPTYNGIPHLLCPAVTQVPKIINSLKWAIGEMDRRYELLAQAGKRDIVTYNEKAEEKMPYLVIVIDELADLMVVSAQEVESSIIRLAQMARAVGIHLIVATQRPSVDVITGLIKANIPARIAFSVASGTDSKTILDAPGAETLIGRGDMLFLTTDLSKPRRIQCCFVGDNDIRKVVDFLISALDEPVQYEEGITEKKAGSNPYDFGYSDDGEDELFEDAKDTVIRAGKASASYLQRRLKIGYARAARLLDLLEERGIIGAGDGAKPRDVLVKPGEGATTVTDGVPEEER